MDAPGEPDSERTVVLGRILGAFGVAGWIKVESFTVPPESLLRYSKWRLQQASIRSDGEWTLALPRQGRMVSGLVHVRLDDIETREQAERLRGLEVGVARGDMPVLPPGQYYWEDLIGLQASTPNGEPLGRIAEIRTTSAHPLLRVVEPGAAGKKSIERWVPLVPERIRAVDLSARRAVLDWGHDW